MLGLVVVYMNGCPYCVEVTGKSSMAKAVCDLVPVYEIERSEPVVASLGVKSFPTIFLATDEVVFKFEGPRSAAALRAFVREKLRQRQGLRKALRSHEGAA